MTTLEKLSRSHITAGNLVDYLMPEIEKTFFEHRNLRETISIAIAPVVNIYNQRILEAFQIGCQQKSQERKEWIKQFNHTITNERDKTNKTDHQND